MYNQLCVMPGVTLGDESPIQFENHFFKGVLGKPFRIKYERAVTTLPDKDEDGEYLLDTGGRPDLLFFVHDEDIDSFSIPRLSLGIRWWEDFLNNGGDQIYPKAIINMYPKRW